MMAEGKGTIGVPELTVGLPFPLVALEVLRFATSEAHLQELVYRGLRSDALVRWLRRHAAVVKFATALLFLALGFLLLRRSLWG